MYFRPASTAAKRTFASNLWQVERRARQLQRQAAVSFAKLNGWKHSEKQFSALMLARASTQYKRDEMVWEAATPHELFDHPLYFREPQRPYRPVAMVGQPYNTSEDDARAIAHKLGLELHAPPLITAS